MDAGVRAQQADVALVVERLAEVHVAAAAPRAERGVTGSAHRPAVCQLAGAQQRLHLERRAQARLDRAVDEAAPAVGEIGAREDEPALGHAAWRRGAACTSPGGGSPRCRARTRRPASRASIASTISSPGWSSSSERCSAARSSTSTTRGVAPEADQQLAAVGQQAVGHEVAERVPRRDRVDAARSRP